VRRFAAVAAAGLAALAVSVSTLPASTASTHMLVGIYDEGVTLYGNPTQTYPVFRSLHAQVIRLNLHWGGTPGVAQRRPFNATDPNDSAYSWGLYDQAVQYASQYGLQVLFSIIDTPNWANGGAGRNHAPRNMTDLRDFALAAATCYSGTWTATNGARLGAVHLWTAWNEPNNPVFLQPQYKYIHRKWVIQSAIDYAHICEAVYAGVHDARVSGDRVACGLTAPRGNNNPNESRASVSPLTFLKAVHNAGLRRFDAWAHHPYYIRPSETPSSKPNSTTAITLGNIQVPIDQVTRYYGSKPIWITEYGWQTNPPDRYLGVSWSKQSSYLSQAFAIARKNPRIQLMLWFLLRDEPNLSGWQSGLETATGPTIACTPEPLEVARRHGIYGF
jgi:Glycosyl hydrolase catalytic core